MNVLSKALRQFRHNDNSGLVAAYDRGTIDLLVEHKDDQIRFLWKLLDDISSAGDIYKPEIDGYFKMVELLCNARDKVANSNDGINIIIKEKNSED